MEILLNGQALNDPVMAAHTSFTDLMAELNRLLGTREEIITEVRVDGREILSWDITELDMSRIVRLDIRSHPARDYAINALGELGDYAAEMLAVLRNADNICAKDGYATVRQKLVEGLDYILMVIETAGTVLKLNLDQSRYDVRSGTQMLKEMKTLKSKMSGATDLAAARSPMRELEFTLTDWLKFLEMLLKRYGDTQAEMGTADEISDEARAQFDKLEQLSKDIKSVVEDLYAGRMAKALDQLQGRLPAFQESLIYLQRLQARGLINYHTLTSEGKSMAEKIPQVSGILKELTDAIQVGDSVLLRDLLEYEIVPFIAFLRQIYGQIPIR